ncbi:uncharacterized protein LOC124411444 [Diprion similis]|uniref:uncharacterized protein LOC124411444 n=1 Tax=Diprion similis TaxID=362088 RepID=UPI001EF95DD4|nr:uncharacterized protein LOC124411444 [Diprion similis]
MEEGKGIKGIEGAEGVAGDVEGVETYQRFPRHTPSVPQTISSLLYVELRCACGRERSRRNICTILLSLRALSSVRLYIFMRSIDLIFTGWDRDREGGRKPHQFKPQTKPQVLIYGESKERKKEKKKKTSQSRQPQQIIATIRFDMQEQEQEQEQQQQQQQQQRRKRSYEEFAVSHLLDPIIESRDSIDRVMTNEATAAGSAAAAAVTMTATGLHGDDAIISARSRSILASRNQWLCNIHISLGKSCISSTSSTLSGNGMKRGGRGAHVDVRTRGVAFRVDRFK